MNLFEAACRPPPTRAAWPARTPVTAPQRPTGHPPPFPDQEDHPQTAAEARGQAAMSGLTWRNSACTDRAENDLHNSSVDPG